MTRDDFIHIRVPKEKKALIKKLAGEKTMTQFFMDLVNKEEANDKEEIDTHIGRRSG